MVVVLEVDVVTAAVESVVLVAIVFVARVVLVAAIEASVVEEKGASVRTFLVPSEVASGVSVVLVNVVVVLAFEGLDSVDPESGGA